MSPLPNWHHVAGVMYHERVLDTLFDLLLSTYVVWGIYVWKGTRRWRAFGFLLWFPMLLVSAVGTALLVHRITGTAAVAALVPVTMYLHPVSLLIALLTQPEFRKEPGYLAAHAAMAAGVLAGFVWIMALVVEPLLLQS